MSRRTKVALAALALAAAGAGGLALRWRAGGEVGAGTEPAAATTARSPSAGGTTGARELAAARGEPAGAGGGSPSREPTASPPRFVVPGERSGEEPSTPPATGTSGELNASNIRTGVMSTLPAIKACYERQLKKDPELSGRLVVKFTVVERDGAGRVSEGTIIPNENGDAGRELIEPLTEQCVLKALASAPFAVPRGGPVEVTYPFTFSAE